MISKKAELLKPSPTMAMANRARELARQGKDVVSLTVGEPDWPTVATAAEAGIKAIQDGFTKYTAAAGMPELRTALAKTMSEELRVTVKDTDVVVGAGAKFVIYGALQMLLDPGDEVLIPAPYWVSYPTMVELCSGVPVIIDCPASQNFKLTPASLEKAITPKTKVLILCSPSNPTGIAYDENELKALAEVLRRYPRLVILSDDIYNRLVFSDDKVAPHLLHVAPDLQPRLVAVNGASKSFSMTGWRIGWAACPPSVAKVLGDYFSQSTSNVCSITQKATLKALENPEAEIQKVRSLLRARLKKFQSGLASIEGLKPVPADGAFYVWLDCQDWMGKTHHASGKKITGSAVLADLLLDQEAVATVPGIEFGAEGYLRLSFATSETQLEKALRRFEHFAGEIR